MFETGTIKSTYDKPLNLGLLLEMLLFYQHINLVLNKEALETLIEEERTLEIMIELCKTKALSIYVLRGNHSILGLSGRYVVKSRDFEDFEKLITYSAINAVYNRKKIAKSHEKLMDSFCDLINPFALDHDIAPIYADIYNADYLQLAIKNVINARFPDMLHPENHYQCHFETHTTDELGKGFFLNIKFSEEIERRLTQQELWMLGGEPVAAIIDTYNNIDISKRFGSDFTSDSQYRGLLTQKINAVSNKINFNKNDDIKLFQDLIIENARSVEIAINTKARTITDYYELYQKTEKFKKWLAGLSHDEKLVKEYIAGITKQNWFDGLGVKSIRWYLFTGAGLIIDAMGGGGLGTMSAGLALSAADTFLLDGLMKGWKPNLFIGDVNNFVGN